MGKNSVSDMGRKNSGETVLQSEKKYFDSENNFNNFNNFRDNYSKKKSIISKFQFVNKLENVLNINIYLKTNNQNRLLSNKTPNIYFFFRKSHLYI